MARNKYPEITVTRILDSALKLFLQNGYEHTTIQNIVDDLGDLSKGAIYHHFKSKDDIIEAAIDQLYTGTKTAILSLKDRTDQSGLEKLHAFLLISLDNQDQFVLLTAAPDLMKNPRFLANQLHSSVKEIAPQIIQPAIEQGIRDGSIRGTNPEEMAEVLMILLNIWLNPSIFTSTNDEMRRKFYYLKDLLEKMGLPVLDEDILALIEKCRSQLEKSRFDKSIE